MDNDYLYHHGVKGMKWGVRRYQNSDGTLTPAGKKRISKQYKKASTKATNKLNKQRAQLTVNAYNKAANYMNGGGIDRFNAQQRKKYGENYTNRDGYVEDYNKEFNELFARNLNKSLNDFYSRDESVRAARDLVSKYDMTKWDDLAKNNEAAIEEVRKAVEQYDY